MTRPLDVWWYPGSNLPQGFPAYHIYHWKRIVHKKQDVDCKSIYVHMLCMLEIQVPSYTYECILLADWERTGKFSQVRAGEHRHIILNWIKTSGYSPLSLVSQNQDIILYWMVQCSCILPHEGLTLPFSFCSVLNYSIMLTENWKSDQEV